MRRSPSTRTTGHGCTVLTVLLIAAVVGAWGVVILGVLELVVGWLRG